MTPTTLEPKRKTLLGLTLASLIWTRVILSGSALGPPLTVGLLALALVVTLGRSNWLHVSIPPTLTILCLVAGVVVLQSVVVGIMRGQGAWEQCRNGLSYVLLFLLPLAGAGLLEKEARRLMSTLLYAGLVAEILLALSWLAARTGTVPVIPLATAPGARSAGLVVAAAAIASARLAEGTQPLIAHLVLLGAPLSQLVAGSRSGFLVWTLISAVAYLVSAGPSIYRKLLRLLAAMTTGIALGAALLLTSASAREMTLSRIALARRVLTGVQDDSFVLRVHQTRLAVQTWKENPAWGGGLSTQYEYPAIVGGRVQYLITTWLDSPAATLAKVGLVGSLVLVAIAILLLSHLSSKRTRISLLGSGIARIHVLYIVCSLPFGSFLEDRALVTGLSISWCILNGLGRGPHYSKLSNAEVSRDVHHRGARL